MSSLYFAYGSNLDLEQMARRCPGARPLGAASLTDHALVFAGQSRTWGGGVATVLPSPGERVFGLLWTMTVEDWQRLDRAEGVPHSYERVTRPVQPVDGAPQSAELYVKPRPTAAPPSPAYLAVLSRGYVRLGFPVEALQTAVDRSRPSIPGSPAP